MGYDRDDRHYGSGPDRGPRASSPGGYYNRGRGGGRDDPRAGEPRGRPDYGRPPQGYDYEERGFLDRAGDEVRSWFGDEEAERRRRFDERFGQRDYDRDNARYGARYGREPYPRDRNFYPDGEVGAGMPVTGFGWADQGGQRAGNARSDHHDHDPSYRSWRDRQIEALDRDYEDYRREHQGRFDSEFAGWRGKRQGQRDSLRQVQEHQEVVGSDGEHVGKVDHVRGDRILLAKNDAGAGGHHHSIPSAWLAKVGDKVELDRTAAQARQAWKDEETNSAIGGTQSGGTWSNDGTSGPRNLNRSFSGTY